jgi:hypothetical protein
MSRGIDNVAEMIRCPICGLPCAITGPSGWAVHIPAAHPDSPIGARIVELLRELDVTRG